MIVLPLEGTRMSDLLKWKKGACEAAKIASNLLLSMRQNFSVREKGFTILSPMQTLHLKKSSTSISKAFSQIMIS